MNFGKIWLSIFLLLVLSPVSAFSQEKSKIELVRADKLRFDKSIGVDAQRLLGDVVFKHKGAMMYCDSAYLYNASNSLDAFGHVRVNQGDTLTMTSDKLNYNGNTQLIKIRDNVVLKGSEMTLSTHTLDYD
ncbi:MAG TPA: OstA-like protein, partial [Cryomorphaceae bacterium]|nr:OstA-like protein [Cryomorphaceae bacterium]